MSERQLRNHLKSAFPNSELWSIKVDRMHVNQVYAVILHMRKNGKL